MNDVYDEIDKILRPNRRYDTNGQAVNTVKVKPTTTKSVHGDGESFDTSFLSPTHPSEPFKISFGITIRFYPNGEAYVESTFPLGKAKSIAKKKAKFKKKSKQVDTTETIITDKEEY